MVAGAGAGGYRSSLAAKKCQGQAASSGGSEAAGRSAASGGEWTTGTTRWTTTQQLRCQSHASECRPRFSHTGLTLALLLRSEARQGERRGATRRAGQGRAGQSRAQRPGEAGRPPFPRPPGRHPPGGEGREVPGSAHSAAAPCPLSILSSEIVHSRNLSLEEKRSWRGLYSTSPDGDEPFQWQQVAQAVLCQPLAVHIYNGQAIHRPPNPLRQHSAVLVY